MICLYLVALESASAMDFMEKRECVIERSNKVPVHTKCLITGGMQGGTIDIAAKTPDGRKYSIYGPTDGEEGTKYMLQKAPAHLRPDSDNKCYERDDRKLAICFGKVTD